jgi:outer membrane receptor for ferrienterochelin and colicins
MAASTRARADDDLSSLLSENVVSGASKTAETSSDAPATITTITSDELRAQGIRTLDEAIAYLALGFSVERNQLGFAQYSSRGVNFPIDWGVHILLVIDGHTVNESSLGDQYPDRNLGLPIEAIDHVEVILGPGSVLYGTNAMQGTFNVVTKSAKSVGGLRVNVEGSLSPGQDRSGALTGPLSNWGNQYRLGLSFGHTFDLLGKPAELTFFAQYLEDHFPYYQVGPQYGAGSGIDQGPNPATTAAGGLPARNVWGGALGQWGFQVPGVYSRFLWNNFELSARFTRWHHFQNETNLGAGQFNQPDGGGPEGFAHIDLVYRADVSEKLQIRPRLYADHYLYNSTDRYYTTAVCITPNGTPIDTPCQQDVPLESWRYGAEVTGTYDWFADGRFSTLAGVDARLVSAFGKTDTWVQSTGQQAGSVGIFKQLNEPTIAVYAQQMAKITSWLRLNAGIRYDYFASVAGLAQAATDQPKLDTPNFDHVSPRGAIIVNPWQGGTLKLVYSEGFRRPSPYEFGFASPGFEVSAPQLVPETVRSIEAMLEQQIRSHHLSLSFFRTWWRGMIAPVLLDSGPNTGLLQYQNAGAIDSMGIHAALQTTLGPFSGGLNVSVSQSYQVTDQATLDAAGQQIAWSRYGEHQPVPGAPSISANAHAAYSFGEGRPTLGLAAYLIGPRIAYQATSNAALLALPSATYAPTTMSARLTLSGQMPGVANLGYRLSGELMTSTSTAYPIGPLSVYQRPDGSSAAELAQQPKLTVMAGLEYKIF